MSIVPVRVKKYPKPSIVSHSKATPRSWYAFGEPYAFDRAIANAALNVLPLSQNPACRMNDIRKYPNLGIHYSPQDLVARGGRDINMKSQPSEMATPIKVIYFDQKSREKRERTSNDCDF
jgi:hypothetical protein